MNLHFREMKEKMDTLREGLTIEQRRVDQLEFCLSQILGMLPLKRDWLDPAIERFAKELLATKASHEPPHHHPRLRDALAPRIDRAGHPGA